MRPAGAACLKFGIRLIPSRLGRILSKKSLPRIAGRKLLPHAFKAALGIGKILRFFAGRHCDNGYSVFQRSNLGLRHLNGRRRYQFDCFWLRITRIGCRLSRYT